MVPLAARHLRHHQREQRIKAMLNGAEKNIRRSLVELARSRPARLELNRQWQGGSAILPMSGGSGGDDQAP
jgi:hypothetical protein